jgi:hypothetical protein
MSKATGTLSLNGTHFAPGEEIRGEAVWSASGAPAKVELRLFWRTEGKGTSDNGTTWEKSFDLLLAEDRREFALTAPAFPPSFSGRLISLLWGMELVVDERGVAAADIVIAPAGVEVSLQRPEWIALDAAWELKKPKWMSRR